MLPWVLFVMLNVAGPPAAPQFSGRFESEHDCFEAQYLANKYGSHGERTFYCEFAPGYVPPPPGPIGEVEPPESYGK